MLDIFLLNPGHFEYYAVRIRSFRNAQFFVLPGNQPSSVLHSVGSGSNIISFFKAFVLLPWIPWKHCLGVSMGLEQWDLSRTYVVVQFSKPLNLSHTCTAQGRDWGLHWFMHSIKGPPSLALSSLGFFPHSPAPVSLFFLVFWPQRLGFF